MRSSSFNTMCLGMTCFKPLVAKTGGSFVYKEMNFKEFEGNSQEVSTHLSLWGISEAGK